MFNSYHFNTEQPKHKLVAPMTIVCVMCYGTGKKSTGLYGMVEMFRKCGHCDGKGTLKLKQPTKDSEETSK
jgi:DnaJ-class molecular chaperone